MEKFCKNVVASTYHPLRNPTFSDTNRLRSDLIFSVPKIVSFVSQGTTLKPGTIILTGTPAGVGHSFSPKEYLRAGDEFSVEILPGIGTMTTLFENGS